MEGGGEMHEGLEPVKPPTGKVDGGVLLQSPLAQLESVLLRENGHSGALCAWEGGALPVGLISH